MSKLAQRIRAFGRKGVVPVIALAAAAAVPGISGAQSTTPHGSSKNIVEVATAAGSFNTLLAAVKAAGLVETLEGAGPFTVFAPTDAAFAKVPKAQLDALLADKTALTALLTYHVVPGRVMASAILKTNGATPKTVNGQAVNITVRGGKVYVGGAQVVSADVQASNGVIHVIDTVLMPPSKAAGN
jgi:transforming growth factor-beta-induced protein